MNKFFPALIKNQKSIFCDNAGGSQIPRQVISSVNKFIENSYVQPYANNNLSKIVTKNIDQLNLITNTIFNNKHGTISYGSSCSQLTYNFSKSIENYLKQSCGEIIISDFNHEACITPFERIANQNNLSIKWWSIDYDINNKHNKYFINYDTLLDMISNKTSLVVIPHVSNILGNIIDIKLLSQEIKKINPDTKVFVDGVAYLPHNVIDVEDFDVDYYVISFYKFCCLRISALYCKNLNDIENQYHSMFDNSETSKYIEVGGINYELGNAVIGLSQYLIDLAKFFNYDNSKNKDYCFTRDLYQFSLSNIKSQEDKLVKIFRDRLKDNHEIEIIEDKLLEKTPIFSLKFKNYDENNINLILNQLNIICKNSTFYCDRFFDSINHNKQRGVLRISLMHYNFQEEIEKICEYLNYFKKSKLELDYIIQKDSLNKISNNLKQSFDNLPIDRYYTTKRCRRYSLVKVDNHESLKVIGDLPFYQSDDYNSYNGNVLREYQNLDIKILEDYSFKKLVKTFTEKCQYYFNQPIKFIQIHQMRVYADNNSVNIIPEGRHKDGFNIIGMTCIERKNINGAVSSVYDDDENLIIRKQLDIGEMLILNDNKMYHDVSNIILDDENEIGYRDIFVFTTIS
tara:strand:+ start:1681 stop:3561 length:1881 start_codon:yes stop_codon:yes gene_type:complete